MEFNFFMAEKIKWTPQQALAIQRRLSNVLVTASAGTGKTAVLSGRCVFFIADSGIRLSSADMLLLTFTDAAAEQMQRRIRQQLQSQLPAHPEKARIINELSLLPAADISTIHSFCKKIISEYFYKLAIDPAFRVIDEDEQRLLKFQSLEKTIEWAWQQSHLTPVLENLFYHRDLRIDGTFSTKIIALSDFLDTIPSRSGWLERTLLLSQATDPSSSLPGQQQKKIVLEKLRKIINRLDFSAGLLKNAGSDLPDWQKDFKQLVQQTADLLQSGDWQKAAENIRNFEKPKRISKPKETAAPVAEIIKNTLKISVDEFISLNELAVLNPDYLDVIGVAVSQQTRLVVELLKKFDDFYSQAKLSANCLDFADLEHYALTLLTEPDGSPAGLKPSDIALLLRKKYKYIFVDEYQDINPVQQAILEALSTGDNIFVVGDVKQSIYAFRGAEPKIFLEHLRPASTDPREARKPLRIDLNANFRSSPGILDFVNKLFGRIMTSSLVGIDYDESAALVSADRTEMTDSKTPLVELHIIDKQAVDTGQDESNEDESAKPDAPDIISLRQCQAYLVAERIRRMVGADTGRAEFKIYDRDIDAFRDVRFRDIAVLMRSPAKRVNDYIKVFQLAGVPVSSDAASEFFEAAEISDMLCLLKLLDNFQRDIELVAVLRSPLFSLSDTDLARIRIHSRTDTGRKSFYDCILAYIADGSDEKLSERLKLIFDTLNRWRLLAKSGSLSDLIWLIYRQSGLLSFVSALPAGPLRRANLLRLHDRAIQFELFASNTAVVSLSRFVDFLEKLLKTETKWSSPEPENFTDEAVRIISVHKSKGLEFPVVFLAELDDRFNYSDLSDDFLPDADLTLGLRIFDRRSKNKVSSLAHQVIAERKYRSLLAEEMRILYVALTRASARLVLTGSLKKNRAVDILLKSLFFEDRSFVDLQLESCDNFLEWILYGLGDCKNLHRLFQTDYEHQASADDGLFSLTLYGGEDLRRFSDSFEKLRLGKKLRVEKAEPQDKSLPSRLLNQLKENLSWVYEFESLSSLPAKRTVTLITHNSDEFVQMDHSKALERRPMAFVPSASADVDVRLLGSAVHLLISRLDLSRPVTRQHAEAAKGKLVQNGFIDIGVAERINVDSIIGFFQTDLGKMVFESANEVFREWPFTFSIPASELPELGHEYRVLSDEPRAPSDEIVVQGMIDMLIRTQSGLFIIDFKTDNITVDRCIERAKIYHTQLALYARAAADIFGSNVLKKCLYFLKPAKLIEVN